ncbi:MAG: zinc ABC transporter substrate-binding protein [Saprospiraceae bacterium]|nr:zinc ABC transporter substrate-binding protein [Saprospiraceae bacterium]
MNLRISIFACLILLTTISCQRNSTESAEGLIKIVATTGMVADAAQAIGGEYVVVESLMGPGVDPHLYKATHGDLKLLRNADVILYNGLHLEGKMAEVFEKMAQLPDKVIHPVAEFIPKAALKVVDPNGPTYDPHIWFDVVLWAAVYKEIGDLLSHSYPEHADYFKANVEGKQAELTVLDGWVQQEINSIPEAQRILITAHDAFEYFGAAYGIQVKGLQGISTLSEAGLRDVKELVDLIVDQQIKAVFVESSVPVRDINAVVKGCKEKGHEVAIGGTLFSDAMGEAGTEEGTYEGMVKSNVNTIVNALR